MNFDSEVFLEIRDFNMSKNLSKNYATTIFRNLCGSLSMLSDRMNKF